MSIDDRHRDKNGEISRKHGNTLVSTLRRIYGPSFAAGESETAKLSDVLAKMHETSLTQLVKDHESGGLHWPKLFAGYRVRVWRSSGENLRRSASRRGFRDSLNPRSPPRSNECRRASAGSMKSSSTAIGSSSISRMKTSRFSPVAATTGPGGSG